MRFRHGIHTIYLFVDGLAPFSDITTELASLLKERYPQGLTTGVAPERITPIPENPIIKYAALNVPNDPSRGWKKINTGQGDSSTAAKCGLKNNSLIAFTFVDDEDEGDVLFEVEWPRDDEELYEQ